MENYLDINRKLWNAKLDSHLKSDFYFVDEFLQGRSSLNSIELELLGNIKGKEILHLQCHFGQDSISLSRLGAKVTGVDLSDKAIEAGKNLAEKCGTDTEFISSDIYNLPAILDKKFDIVYTTYGTIGWLPDLEKWAKVISNFLKPGGKLIFVEFHPFIWMYNDDFTEVEYDYFQGEPIIETTEGTYADQTAKISLQEVGWNHELSSVIQSLINENLEIKNIQEYNYSPYSCFKNMQETDKGKFQIPQFGHKVPYVYSLVSQKN